MIAAVYTAVAVSFDALFAWLAILMITVGTISLSALGVGLRAMLSLKQKSANDGAPLDAAVAGLTDI